MQKANKIKIFIGLFYIVLVGIILLLIFSNFSIDEITSYNFIKNNRDYFFGLKENNIIFLSILFVVFCIIWVFAGGFGSPVVIFAGFVFGNWLGTFLLLIGLTIGATALYIFANYFLRDFIKNKFLKKFQNLEYKFKKSEFFYLVIYRFIGGIPFAISNILPCIFDVKVKNFFWATIIALTPQLFLLTSVASGIEKVIDQNAEAPGYKDVILDPSIYIPLAAFFFLLIITVFIRKFFYND